VPLRIITSPYANEQRLKTALSLEKSEEELRSILKAKWEEIDKLYCDNQGVNILLSHHFFVKEGEKAIEDSDDEKPILYVGGAHEIFTNAIPKSIHYTALGHLHRFQKVEGGNAPVVYSGSPIAYSFAEANQDKYIAILNFDKENKLSIDKITLNKGKKLVRQKFEDIDEAVVWLLANQDILVELTIVAEKYLLAEDRQRLFQAHEGIISIIPEIKGTSEVGEDNSEIDLGQSITSLFKQYFKDKNGQEPNDRIIDLFNEIQSDNKL
jgi:exonuclease SbcD